TDAEITRERLSLEAAIRKFEADAIRRPRKEPPADAIVVPDNEIPSGPATVLPPDEPKSIPLTTSKPPDRSDLRRFLALRRMDVIVELHDSGERKCSEIVPSRFAPTHDVKMVHRCSRDLELPRIFDQLGDLDRLLATWEWRVGPTPWAVMTAREREHAEG